jgi:hypothetical protein
MTSASIPDPIARQDWERDAEGHLVAFADREAPIVDTIEIGEGDGPSIHMVFTKLDGRSIPGFPEPPGKVTETALGSGKTPKPPDWEKINRDLDGPGAEHWATPEAEAYLASLRHNPEPPYPHKRGLRLSVTFTRERVARALEWIARRIRK